MTQNQTDKGAAKKMEWHQAISQLESYVFKISTPDGFGTGFLLSKGKKSPLCALVTAAHVIDQAH
jgi:hypothetical protein